MGHCIPHQLCLLGFAQVAARTAAHEFARSGAGSSVSTDTGTSSPGSAFRTPTRPERSVDAANTFDSPHRPSVEDGVEHAVAAEAAAALLAADIAAAGGGAVDGAERVEAEDAA